MKKISLVLLLVSLVFASNGVAVADDQQPQSLDVKVAAYEPVDAAVTLDVNGQSAELPKQLDAGVTTQFPTQVGQAVIQTNASVNEENAVAVVATESALSIGWDFAKSDTLVQISLNGEIVANQPSSGSISTDTFVASGPSTIQVTQISPAKGNAASVQTLATVSLTLVQPQAAQTTSTSVVIPQATSTVLRYQTFIPYPYVPAPHYGCGLSWYWYNPLTSGDPYYQGNNRDFSMPSSNNKTAAQLNIDWVAETWTHNQTVGQTNGYLLNPATGAPLQKVYSATASEAGIGFSVGKFYSNSVYVHMWENVENPDCGVGGLGIHYNIDGQVFKSGGYSLSGDFRTVPSHEFAYRDSLNHFWEPIYRNEMQGYDIFNCFDPLVSLAMPWCIQTDSWQTGSNSHYVSY